MSDATTRGFVVTGSMSVSPAASHAAGNSWRASRPTRPRSLHRGRILTLGHVGPALFKAFATAHLKQLGQLRRKSLRHDDGAPGLNGVLLGERRDAR